MTTHREELYRLVDALPEKEIGAAARFLSFIIASAQKELTMSYLNSLPVDDESLTEEDLLAIEAAEKDIAEGRVKSWEQIKKEMDR
ncbi:MAG: hypothetical protein ACYC4H_09650 [Desulfocucumaceae bacterium]